MIRRTVLPQHSDDKGNITKYIGSNNEKRCFHGKRYNI